MVKFPTLQELLEAGVHFGHKVSRGNPKMRPYIYGVRDGVHIIDLTSSDKYLKEACEFLVNLGKEGKTLLLVGTKKQAKPIIEELAQNLNIPYLTNRWIGGFLTNFEEISKNIKILKDLKEQKEKGELKKYTKKEQLLLDRKIAKLERDFSGVAELTALPDAIFIIDTVRENVAVKEAARKGIKVVAITDTNSDPTWIDYPVPGNDDAIKSITILTHTLIGAFEEGAKQAVIRKEEKEKEEQNKAAADEVAIPEEDVAVAEEIIEKKALEESERKVT